MEGDTSVKSNDDHEASEEVIVNEDKTYCDIIPIIVTEASDKQVIQYRKEERSIPIEIIGTIDEIDENEETFPYPLEIKSNRTSLIITHDDGTTEENECEVTCLGVTPDFGCKKDLHIEEIIQENMNIVDKVLDFEEEGRDDDNLLEDNHYDLDERISKEDKDVKETSCVEFDPQLVPADISAITVTPADAATVKYETVPEKNSTISPEQSSKDQTMNNTAEKQDVNIVINEVTNDSEIQLEKEKRKSLVSEQIRIIPIALPDGRQVINRSISGDRNILEKHFVQGNKDLEENNNEKLPFKEEINIMSESTDEKSSLKDINKELHQNVEFIRESKQVIKEENKSSKEHLKESKKIVASEHTLSKECEMKTSLESCEMISSTTTSKSDSYQLSGNSDGAVSNISNQMMCCGTPDTSVSSADIKQTEVAGEALAEEEKTLGCSFDSSPSNTCSSSDTQSLTTQIDHNTATEVIDDHVKKTEQNDDQECVEKDVNIINNEGLYRNSNGSLSNIRNIPISIELDNCSSKEDLMKKEQNTVKERTIPIEIITEEKKKQVLDSSTEENKASSNMSSIRTIPIQRMNSGSSCESSSCSSSLPKTSSRESLNASTQKIKMGTAAIRIPIQIQRSNDTVDNNVQGQEKKLNPETKVKEVSASKPPQSVRTVPILRQSLSDSGVGKINNSSTNKQGSRSRNVSAQSDQSDRLQKVHEELEEARMRVAAQADVLSQGFEHLIAPSSSSSSSRGDNRSRSLDVEHRNVQGVRPNLPSPSPSLQQNVKRDRSSQDIDKGRSIKRDRSLQDIDKDIETIWKELQQLDNPEKSSENNNSTLQKSPTPEPLSQQKLVTPPWKSSNSTLPPTTDLKSSSSASNPNISSSSSSMSQKLNPSTSSSSRHTIWDIPETRKYEPTPVSAASYSWDNKPNYFPTKSNTHFSFVPKADTKPGVITPAYVPENPSPSSTGSRPVSRNEDGNENKSIRNQSSSVSDLRKSCLKTQSTQSLKSRSQSPSIVKFSPKLPKRSSEKKPEKHIEPDPPFEWVEFRRPDGEIVKGTVLPPLHRNEDVTISRNVPIVNMLLEDAINDDRPVKTVTTNTGQKTYEDVEPKAAKPVTKSCDAETQTEKSDKKSGCGIM